MSFTVHGIDRSQSISDYLSKDNYHWIESSELELDERVQLYNSVMSQLGSLVDTEEFISFHSTEYDTVSC